MNRYTGEITLLLILFLLVVPALLIRKFNRDKLYKRAFWQFGDYNVLVVAVLSLLVFFVTLNILKPGPDITDPDTAIEYGKKRELPRYTQWGYEIKMLSAPSNLSHHFHLISSIKKAEHENEAEHSFNFFGAKNNLRDFYEKLSNSSDSSLRDAGNFGLACDEVFYVFNNPHADELLNKISDQNKTYVQFVHALCVSDNDREYVKHLKLEIKNKGFLEGATRNLCSFYFHKKDYTSLLQLYQDPATFPYMDNYYKKYLSFKNYHFFDYLIYELQQNFQQSNILGFIGGILIFLTWFYYIQRIDIYEREKKRDIIFALFCGLTFPLLTSYLYSFLHQNLNFGENGDLLNDLAYCIGGIGLVEEIIKIIPFLIVLRFTKAINEPVDYLIFGALSGLCFSFMENLLYFDEAGLRNIHGRALWCAITHMFDTCIIAYTLMLARYRWKKSAWIWFWPGLFMAATVHGLYDYFLINPHLKEFWFASFLILLSSILVFTSMINNCLNNSPFFEYYRKINTHKLGAIICSCLLGVIIFEYICITFIYGNEIGNFSLLDSLLSSWYLLMFLTMRLTNLDIIPGRWEKLQFFASLNPFIFIMKRKINYGNYLGREIVIHGGRKDSPMLAYLPLKGKITERHVISDYAGWFTLELDKALASKNQTHTKVLMRTKEKNMELDGNENITAGLFIIDNPDDLKNQETTEEQLVLLDWVLIR